MPLPIDNYQASLALTQSFVVQGVFPSPDSDPGGIPIAAIRTFAGNFAIGAGAEGQVIPISQNTAVFSLIGTMYGGNGTSTFALPDLDGRTLIGGAPLQYLDRPAIGSSGITLSSSQLPASLGGSSQPIDNYQPSQLVTYLIRETGVFPSVSGGGGVNMIGEIVPFAGHFVPGGYLEAAGQVLQIADHETLFQLIGTTYGGDGINTFQLPDLRGRTIVGASPQLPLGTTEGQAEAVLFNGNLPVSVGGSGQPIDNQEPSLALTYLIALQGIFPSPNGGGFSEVEPCLGEVMAFAGDFAPKGWAMAAGQLLPINQNQALFSLLGTMYGGNGQTTFALPDLRGRTVIGTGDVADAGDVLGSNDATVLSSNIFDAQLIGTSDSNTLTGGDGNDSLDGAGGADAMFGGVGNDVYYVDNIGDVVIENASQGTDTVFSTVHLALPANVEILALQGGADLQGAGNGLVNTLYGNAGNNILDGTGGADNMAGGAGNDVYFVDNAGDLATENANEGNDIVFSNAHLRLSANVETLVLQGIANLQGAGNSLVNTLYGNAGNNILDGDAGADTMFGGAGNDVYFIDNGGDGVTENANEGNDAVFSTVHLRLAANVETLVLQGTAHLQGAGNSLVNVLHGNAGNNILDGDAGADTMFGGAGNDVYYVDNAGDLATENANEGNDAVFSTAHLRLAANVETLVLQGTAHLQGAGNSLVNMLYGNAGNNILDGDAGADAMFGGAGNDLYYVDNGGDGVTENANEGNDTVFSTADLRLSANVETLVLQGTADLQGAGNSLVNTLYGNAGNNILDGDAGADTMFGGAGNDVYYVDNAGDLAIENANEGNDIVFSTAHLRLSANVETLVLQGAAHLQGAGNSLVNTLYGNAGNNILDGDAGGDAMFGGAGNDIYFVDNAGDLAFENFGEGTDVVFSTVDHTLASNVETLVLQGAGNLLGTGNALNNTLQGNSGDNTLAGAAGQDQLIGAQGNDLLFGGAEVDSLFGGIGQDTFFFTGTSLGTLDTGVGANRDVIHDFSGDLLHLVQVDANVNVAADQAFSFIGTNAFTAAGQVRFFADGAGNTIVEGNMDDNLGADFQLELRSFTGQLQVSDFLL